MLFMNGKSFAWFPYCVQEIRCMAHCCNHFNRSKFTITHLHNVVKFSCNAGWLIKLCVCSCSIPGNENVFVLRLNIYSLHHLKTTLEHYFQSILHKLASFRTNIITGIKMLFIDHKKNKNICIFMRNKLIK